MTILALAAVIYLWKLFVLLAALSAIAALIAAVIAALCGAFGGIAQVVTAVIVIGVPLAISIIEDVVFKLRENKLI